MRNISSVILILRDEPVHGFYFVQRYDALKKNENVPVKIPVPKGGLATTVTDAVSLYGYRPNDERLRSLSPWFFTQWCQSPHPDLRNLYGCDDLPVVSFRQRWNYTFYTPPPSQKHIRAKKATLHRCAQDFQYDLGVNISTPFCV